MTGRPTLTVFMPVYNGKPYLASSVESVLGQTFSDFEFLIVDDGSTDGSAEIIEGFHDPRIRLIRQENRGCYPARNRALEEAGGRYLANMDADDISLADRFRKQIDYLETYREVVLVGTRSLECDREDTVRLPRPDSFRYDGDSHVPHVLRRRDTQRAATFTLPTMLFRSSLVERIGPYDSRLCFGADLDFVARAALVGTVGCLPERLYVFRDLPTSISSTGSKVQKEILTILDAVASRVESGEIREFTPEEIKRLEELSATRKNLTSLSERRKQAYYETRLATLFRVNGRYPEAAKHALAALRLAPEHLLLDRKLVGNLLRSLFRGEESVTL